MGDYMEHSIEQTVCGNRTIGKRLLYMLMWALVVAFLFGAAICASAVLSESAEGDLRIGWISLAGVAVFLLMAYLSWRWKDMNCVDYDYCLCDDEIAVCAVYNSKRRKPILNIKLSTVSAFGSVNSDEYRKLTAHGALSKYKCYANAASPLYYFLYESKGKRNIAILELDPRMLDAVRRARRRITGRWE